MRRLGWAGSGGVLVGACLTGCLGSPAPAGTNVAAPLAAVQHPSSALVVALDPADPVGSAARVQSLLLATGRDGEQAVVLCGRRAIASDPYPAPAESTVGAPPTPPSHPTEFQRSQFEKRRKSYQGRVAHAAGAEAAAHRLAVAGWAAGLVAKAGGCAPAQEATDTRGAIDTAQATFSGLAQAGTDVAGRKVLVLEGSMTSTPDLSAESLAGVAVVLPGYAGDVAGQAGWKVRLGQIGAADTAVLPPAPAGQANTVIAGALSGLVVAPAAGDALFPLGSTELTAAGKAALRQWLTLLAVRYPHSTATVNGYTDSVGDPGQNDLLARRRAENVVQWLVHEGVARARLTFWGHGADDPVAPNRPSGEPANRRVVLVLDAAG
jgi:outer membrane protein OmpA-like peptidoglycan-associated protein